MILWILSVVLRYSLFHIRKLDLCTADAIYALSIQWFYTQYVSHCRCLRNRWFQAVTCSKHFNIYFQGAVCISWNAVFEAKFKPFSSLNRHIFGHQRIHNKNTIQLHRTRHFNRCLWKVNKYKPNRLKGDESGYPEQKVPRHSLNTPFLLSCWWSIFALSFDKSGSIWHLS